MQYAFALYSNYLQFNQKRSYFKLWCTKKKKEIQRYLRVQALECFCCEREDNLHSVCVVRRYINLISVFCIFYLLPGLQSLLEVFFSSTSPSLHMLKKVCNARGNLDDKFCYDNNYCKRVTTNGSLNKANITPKTHFSVIIRF